MRELKATPLYIKSIKGREVTGIFAVMGNLDDYNDKGWPGMFSKTFQERAGKIFHLWQHDFQSPPIAIIKSLREVGRDELPETVLSTAPEALGGAEVVREYLDTERADEVFKNIQAGAPLQMSYAYDAVKYDFEELPGAKYDWERQRNLREVRLYETSDVLWGANDATVAAKALLPADFLLKQLLEQIEQWKAQAKEGRRNSDTDQARINTIASLAIELGASNVKLLDAENPDKTAPDQSRAADPTALTPASALPETVSRRAAQDAHRQWMELRRRINQLGVQLP
jgi:HK97 family phage prohead protease